MTENLVKIDDEVLAGYYDQMLTRLNGFYKKGFYAWVETENPYIAKRLVILDEKINVVWEQCNRGEATLMMFRAGAKMYEDTVRKAMCDYE
jgi:hypothetical protein